MTNLAVRILCGLLAGAATYGVFSFFLLKKEPRMIKPVPREPRLELLRNYGGYAPGPEPEKYRTVFVLNRKIPDILRKYDYLSYSGRASADQDDFVFAMLDFVCDHFKHSSNARLPRDHSMAGIIEGCRRNGGATNCRGLSLILAELLRMNGIRARHVTCKPYEEPFTDCHVVVDCCMPSGKRIMLDPTYRLYFVDDNGRYVSVARLREGIISGDDFYPNAAASYNGEAFIYGNYREYMAKNLLRLNANLRLDDSRPDRPDAEIELVPAGYATEGFPNRIQFVTDPAVFWNM